jgi:DNA-binding GntR family transcriptional regulator
MQIPMPVSPALPAGIRPVATATVGLLVYRLLRDYLMAGQFQPGQKLTLRELATALGVSPMPVREAVRRLAAEGALEILPNRRIRVVMMTKPRFRELRSIRLALEGMAVEAATRLISVPEIERLVALNEAFTAEMRRAQADGTRLFRVNKDIHFAVYEAAAMPMLLAMIEGLWLQAGPLLHFSLQMRANAPGPNPAPEWHGRLFVALRARDPSGARAALEGDLMSAGDQILAAGILPD